MVVHASHVVALTKSSQHSQKKLGLGFLGGGGVLFGLGLATFTNSCVATGTLHPGPLQLKQLVNTWPNVAQQQSEKCPINPGRVAEVAVRAWREHHSLLFASWTASRLALKYFCRHHTCKWRWRHHSVMPSSAGSKPVRIRTYLHETPQKTKTDMYKFAPWSPRL